MFVSLLYSILHGFLFSYGVLALQTVPLEKKKQLVLFFFFFPLPVSYGSFPNIPLLHPSGVRTDLRCIFGTSCFSGSRLLYGRHFPGFLHLPVRFLPF